MTQLVLGQVLNGAIVGAMYGIIALGITLTFGITGIVNFALGEFMMIGAYATYALAERGGLPYPVAVVPGCLVAAAAGYLSNKAFFRFTRNNLKHPTYLALAELGKAIKTIFLCQYLHSESLRQEIQEGLNVIENWNGTNNFILYGKGGEIASNDLENQEITMLALHLLQISLVYLNTLMIQRILGEPNWRQHMTPEDLRALTLVYTHVIPYVPST